MLTKITRQDALEKYSKFPTSDVISEQYYFPATYSSAIYTLNSKSPKGHASNLSIEIKKIIANLDFSHLVFLGDSPIAWRYFESDYKPAAQAAAFLAENKIGKKFNGGLMVNTNNLEEFIKHLFWLTRCNACLPYIYFSNEEQTFLGNICKYGSLHLYTLNQKTDKKINKLIKASAFQRIQGYNCYEHFSKNGAIKGRELKVS